MGDQREQFVAICGCGCGQPTRLAKQSLTRLGHVKGQPVRYIFGHSGRQPVAPELRFWPKVDAADCWEWTGNCNNDGYGQFLLADGRVVRAHRWAWEYLVGPIPADMQVDHLCRNRRCVNPDHLEIVSAAENARRCFSPAHRAHRSGTCQRGHLMTGENVYLHRGRPHCRTCNRRAVANYRARGHRMSKEQRTAVVTALAKIEAEHYAPASVAG